MSRLYDTVEPSVVDEEMLQKAVEEQGPKEEAGQIAKEEGIDFADVTALRLDFKNILKIDNLWCFTNLVKLQLDNNTIEKIEGLEMLTKLVWLDLSFNNIEVIEGLENLTRLEDLTLYNNRIQKIENMDALTELHVFSVGNNDLKDLENLVYLRRFKKLQTLNLSGNPLCELAEYKPYTVTHLPSIQYLDYRLVDEAARQNMLATSNRYDMRIQEIQQEERIQERSAEEQRHKREEHELHKAAYMENLNGPQLFESMYAEDAEGQKLNKMPAVDEMLLGYQDKFTAVCQELFQYGLQKHEERQAEVSMFWECLREAKDENKQLGVDRINEFMEYKKKLWLELGQISDQNVLEIKVQEYGSQVSELWEALMGFEMQLVDQLEDAIKEFERQMADLVQAFIEHVQGLTAQCRELENQHHEKLLETSIITLEKVVKNELEEEIDDDLRELFVDKDTIINAVTSSHDTHLLKIDNREEDITGRINQWMSSLMEEVHEQEEIQRNRARVTEINNLIDHLREELDNLDLQGPMY